MNKKKLFTLMISPVALLMLNSTVVHADEVNVNKDNLAQTSQSNNAQENKEPKEAAESEASQSKPNQDNEDKNKDNQSENAQDEDEELEDDVTVEEYEKNVKDFKQVNMAQVKDMISKKDNQDRVMYIGRPTCYYCRQFSPDLKDFNKIIKNNLLYFNIDAEKGAYEYVFEEIGIPGTPTTMRFINNRIVSAWIGGEKTGQELYDFLYSPQANELAESLKIKDEEVSGQEQAKLQIEDISGNSISQKKDIQLNDFKPATLFANADNVASSNSDLNKVVNTYNDHQDVKDEKNEVAKTKSAAKKVQKAKVTRIFKEVQNHAKVESTVFHSNGNKLIASQKLSDQKTLPQTSEKENGLLSLFGIVIVAVGGVFNIFSKNKQY